MHGSVTCVLATYITMYVAVHTYIHMYICMYVCICIVYGCDAATLFYQFLLSADDDDCGALIGAMVGAMCVILIVIVTINIIVCIFFFRNYGIYVHTYICI